MTPLNYIIDGINITYSVINIVIQQCLVCNLNKQKRNKRRRRKTVVKVICDTVFLVGLVGTIVIVLNLRQTGYMYVVVFVG